MTSIYLDADNSRWASASEQDLLDAINGGLLGETHYVEFKRELTPGKGANRELARDLASFAVDGGTLIVGIEEDKANQTFSAAPQTLDG